MIGNSKPELIWVVFWATVLNSIGPLCLLYCAVAAFFPSAPRWPLFGAIPESMFFIWMYIYLRHHLQRETIHPMPTSKEDRQILFDRCLNTTQDYDQYLSDWFLKRPTSTMGRENVKEFIRWAFLNTDIVDYDHEDEVESYLKQLEVKLGTEFPQGKTSVRCLRLTLDKVNALHRSLTWYMCIFVVDSLTHLYLRYHGFHFHRASVSKSLNMLPPRPQALIASKKSPSETVSYWHIPHTATKELPILFLHGIGVGLYPYMEFLKEMNQNRQTEDGEIGILAVEILPISSRFTTAMPPREEMCRQIRTILDHHSLSEVVLLTHSYGSVIATHMLKTPELAARIASVILVDPVSILLNQPDVAYNFVSLLFLDSTLTNTNLTVPTVRKPQKASEWLLWYFGSKDIGIAHTLSRTFFWSENVLWKEDLLDHRSVIFLAEKDSIVNAAKVRTYLEKDSEKISEKSLNSSTEVEKLEGQGDTNSLKLVWCDGMDHGQVFDLPAWRARLKEEVLREARRGQ